MQLAFEMKEESFFDSQTRNIEGLQVTYRTGEFWTSKQRQANPIHEISYRACFKPQLPDYFILKYTSPTETVYDPFAGRGTTAIQAALQGREVIQNDINPLSTLLTSARLAVPELGEISKRLSKIEINNTLESDLDLDMFFHRDTLKEILSLKEYFNERKQSDKFDEVDSWINMVATNRLTGHSSGFFSVYSFPPNQAVSQKSQIRINKKRNQEPQYRDTLSIILKKSQSLQSKLDPLTKSNLRKAFTNARFYSTPANSTPEIKDNSVALTVTSPPFLDTVQYSEDNWLRCWFNALNSEEISRSITIPKDSKTWGDYMESVLRELFRITKTGGRVAFEVGEVRKQSIYLDEIIVPLATLTGFKVEEVMINAQEFTKTSNLWGISNNKSGTNTNRIVVLVK